jgi:hypothetical protein
MERSTPQVGQYMAPMEPRVSDETLSSECLARRCSTSWNLVAQHHRCCLVPRAQMGIRHVKGAGGFGDGALVASRGRVGNVGWTGGHPSRGRAVGGVMAGAGALEGVGIADGAPVATRGRYNIPIHTFVPVIFCLNIPFRPALQMIQIKAGNRSMFATSRSTAQVLWIITVC